jgi:hypothetical protein
MVRRLYLLALLALQLALIVRLAPPLAQALRADALPGLAPQGLPALLQFVATGPAVAGAALASRFPVSRRCATAVPGRTDSWACPAGPWR